MSRRFAKESHCIAREVIGFPGAIESHQAKAYLLRYLGSLELQVVLQKNSTTAAKKQQGLAVVSL